VPLGDDRIDFYLHEIRRLESRTLAENKEVKLGLVILNPIREGALNGTIVVFAIDADGKQLEFEVPFRAFVKNKTVQAGKDNQIVSFDVSKFMIENPTSKQLVKKPQFKPVMLTSPFIIQNFLDKPLFIKGIVNNNEELQLRLPFEDSREVVTLAPGEAAEVGKIELNTLKLKGTQIERFLALEANGTLVPFSVHIFDRTLLCIWEEEFFNFRFI